GKADLGCSVPVLNRGFRPFLVVHHEIDRETGAARPFRIGWISPIPDEIAIVSTHHSFLPRQACTSTVNGASSVTNSSSVWLCSSQISTAKRAGRSRTVSG